MLNFETKKKKKISINGALVIKFEISFRTYVTCIFIENFFEYYNGRHDCSINKWARSKIQKRNLLIIYRASRVNISARTKINLDIWAILANNAAEMTGGYVAESIHRTGSMILYRFLWTFVKREWSKRCLNWIDVCLKGKIGGSADFNANFNLTFRATISCESYFYTRNYVALIIVLRL